MINKDISFLPSIRKAKRMSETLDKDQASEFFEILKHTYKPNPDPKDIQALRKWVDDYPEIWVMVFDMSQVIESNLINRMAPNQAAFLALEKNVDEIREDLAYDDASPMERMLIDSIVLSWLRYQWTEYRLLIAPSEAPGGIFWEKRVSIAQARYLKACETLAKVRKLSLKDALLQVNIATQSGQQVNVAGDLIKK